MRAETCVAARRLLDEVVGEPRFCEATSIEISVGSSGEIVVSANRHGLVRLGHMLLKLAEKNIHGAHEHVDAASLAGKAEAKLIFELDLG